MATKYSRQSRKVRPDTNPVTLQTINQHNQRYWDRQKELMDRRMSVEAFLAIALIDIHSDYERMVPVAWQISFVQALARAEDAVRLARRDFSRRGGQARKTDALQKLIEEIVRETANITQRELLHRLGRQMGQGVIESIDSESSVLPGDRRNIHFHNNDERPKTASVKGLKDRLSRIKKTFAPTG